MAIPYDTNMKPPLGTPLQAGHPLAKGLVGAWLMNEGGGDAVYDLSGNGGNGAITRAGGGTWLPGSTGIGLNLDSNSNDRIQISGNRPISDLIKTKGSAGVLFDSEVEIAAGAANAPFFHNTDNINYFTLVRVTDTSIRFQCNSGASTASETFTVPDLWDGNTHFVFVTWDWNTGDSFCYVDGVLVDSDNSGVMAAPADKTTSFLNIGGDSLATNTISGTMQLALIYDRTLTASEIAELHQNPYAMFKKEPIELWSFIVAAGGNPWYQYAQQDRNFIGVA